jgi:hypothetical protein
MGALDERQALIHELRNQIQIIAANLIPLAREVKTREGREILADMNRAAEGATRVCRLLAAA